ncbi:hypothetical protein SALBM135S_07739 [Streptomyces alboniger]
MAPAEGLSSPATRLSSVDFPQPDAPSSVTNSPGATSRVMSSRTSWVPAGPSKLFDTCSMRAACVVAVRMSSAGAEVVLPAIFELRPDGRTVTDSPTRKVPAAIWPA